MGSYDAAMKVILAHCREAALEFFLGLKVEETEIVGLPQQTVLVRRSDFPMRVRTSDRRVFIVVLEVQFDRHGAPLRTGFQGLASATPQKEEGHHDRIGGL
ncbi:MAG: hypothetical protein H5U10_14105 [Desulfacinum sp.]|jgi:hypothetical protein|nr:hypothetical protein [Desulfacinum sp.]